MNARRRKTPFLHRNVTQALKHWENAWAEEIRRQTDDALVGDGDGGAVAGEVDGADGAVAADGDDSPSRRAQHHQHGIAPGARPAKRQRVGASTRPQQPPGHKGVGGVMPADGMAGAAPIDRHFVEAEPAGFQKACRIDVRRFLPKRKLFRGGFGVDGGGAARKSRDERACARCNLSLWYDAGPTADGGGKDGVGAAHGGGVAGPGAFALTAQFTLRHKDSRVCTVTTRRGLDGKPRDALVALTQPFMLTEDNLFVKRDGGRTVGFAERYRLVLEFESWEKNDEGDGREADQVWPPLDLDGPDPQRQLRAMVLDLFIRNNEDRRLSTQLLLLKEAKAIITDYIVDVDVAWTTGLSARAMFRKLEGAYFPSILARSNEEEEDEDDVDAEADALSISGVFAGGAAVSRILGSGQSRPLANGDSNGVTHQEEDEDMLDPEQDTDANDLELTPGRGLRARAQTEYNLKRLSDKALGRQRKQRKAKEPKDKEVGSQRVTYNLAATPMLALDGFQCICCCALNPSMNQLKVHVRTHEDFDFEFNDMPGGGCTIRVSKRRRESTKPTQGKTLQLGKPLRILDLQKYVEGDSSWITSRYGPEHERVDESSHPIRSVGKLGARRFARGHERKVLVPRVKQTLYHPVSRQELTAGEPLPPMTADDSWLIQKHGDTIQDFSDVLGSEKAFIRAWDGFILRAPRVLSDAYLSRAWLSFVAEKAAWLAADPQRMVELGKHMIYLRARGALEDDAIVRQALDYIDAARKSIGVVASGGGGGGGGGVGVEGVEVVAPKQQQQQQALANGKPNMMRLPLATPAASVGTATVALFGGAERPVSSSTSLVGGGRRDGNRVGGRGGSPMEGVLLTAPRSSSTDAASTAAETTATTTTAVARDGGDALSYKLGAAPKTPPRTDGGSAEGQGVVDLNEDWTPSQPVKSRSGCGACDLPIRGPSLVICCNPTCTRRGYHDFCVRATAIQDVDSAGWFCNACIGEAAA